VIEYYGFTTENKEEENRVEYWFKSKAELVYYVCFDATHAYLEDFDPYPHLSQFGYVLGFFPTVDVFEKSRDPMIGATIATIVADFMSKFPKIIVLYQCETSDGLQRNRKIRFGNWYHEYGKDSGVVRKGIDIAEKKTDGTVKMHYLGYFAFCSDEDKCDIDTEFEMFAKEKVASEKAPDMAKAV